jgi:hypothetical protein
MIVKLDSITFTVYYLVITCDNSDFNALSRRLGTIGTVKVVNTSVWRKFGLTTARSEVGVVYLQDECFICLLTLDIIPLLSFCMQRRY